VVLRIGIVVGEISGDNLAVPLIKAFKEHYSDVRVEGILGPGLLKEGGFSLYPQDRLAVMGLVEPLKRLPELFRIRRNLVRHFTQNPPDIFIGIDSPDFNLGLEKKLKQQGIPTVHYVSPSVWAWRQGRITGIKQSVDLMLTLFPFEAQFYEQYQVPVCFTGHPLADQIPFSIDTARARTALGITDNCRILTLMPGSRNNELKYLAEMFILTAKHCYQSQPNLHCVIPVVSVEHRDRLQSLWALKAPEVPVQFSVGNAHTAIAAADAVLVTSGTATLEVMLHKKPMVVAYRMHPLTYHIAKHLVKIPYIALPNLLANEVLVPEYIQSKADPESLSKALLAYLDPQYNMQPLIQRYNELHLSLRQNASVKAFQAIHPLLK